MPMTIDAVAWRNGDLQVGISKCRRRLKIGVSQKKVTMKPFVLF